MEKNIEYKYQTSYDNCKKQAGESVKLLHVGYKNYLVKDTLSYSKEKNRRRLNSSVATNSRLSVDLQDRLLCLEFTSFDQLIEAAERNDNAVEQRDARKKMEMR
jgi:hypothetical protein